MHLTIRLEEERLCTLVVIGVRPDGTKEVVALEDGYRESAESWRTLLRDLERRGLRARCWRSGRALKFWAAVRDIWLETAEQQCWVHRIANVLDKLPRSLQPRAKHRTTGMTPVPGRTRTPCTTRRRCSARCALLTMG